ncbi:MAG: hypothetical protein HUU31_26340 [Anaerolineae bacterium]|nr:hypothetical protein [Anaerolineae bacterium]
MRSVMLAAAAGALAALLIVSDGVAVSWDGEAYLAAARAIREMGGIPRDWASYPPLHPLLLAAVPPASMLTWASALNVLALAITAGLAAALMPAGRRGMIVALVIVGGAVRHVQGYVLAESVFGALVLAFAVGVQRRSWAMMMVAAALASLQRYVGVALVPAGMAALWMMHHRRAIPAFAVGAAAPAALWMARNLATVGAPMGVRVAGEMSLDMSVQAALDTLIGWLPMLIVAWQGAPRARLTREARLALAIYCAGHVALVIVGGATTNLDVPGDRLLAPIFVPAACCRAADLTPCPPLRGRGGKEVVFCQVWGGVTCKRLNLKKATECPIRWSMPRSTHPRWSAPRAYRAA